jgi:protein-L-isoaspartate(D-aspartate) O-methyltransferase
LGYDKVRVRNGDGAEGWPEEAPFDAIIVSAAAWHKVPPALLEQLKPGGRLVVPLERGPRGARFPFFSQDQVLLLIEKQDDGTLRRREILPVAFVPLVSAKAGDGLS